MQIVLLNEIETHGLRVSYFSDNIRQFHSIPFVSISSVVVFKRDLFAYDLICTHLWLNEKEAAYELDEDDPQWMELVEQLPALLPGTTPWTHWFSDVAFPAFETNPLEIFRRK